MTFSLKRLLKTKAAQEDYSKGLGRGLVLLVWRTWTLGFWFPGLPAWRTPRLAQVGKEVVTWRAFPRSVSRWRPKPSMSWAAKPAKREVVLQATSQEMTHQDDFNSGVFVTRFSGVRPRRTVSPVISEVRV